VFDLTIVAGREFKMTWRAAVTQCALYAQFGHNIIELLSL
jgi:hypothetical protein